MSLHGATRNTIFFCFFITFEDNGKNFKYYLIVDGYSFKISRLKGL